MSTSPTLARRGEPLYVFGVPGRIGGAATKLRALLRLLRDDFAITVVVPDDRAAADPAVRGFLGGLDIPCLTTRRLPARLSGSALGVCDLEFFRSGTARRIKQLGLRLLWSNEMMWAFPGEAEAVREGLVDKVLFASEFQADHFAALYRDVPRAVTGNYVDPEDFAFRERRNPTFTLGRLSRPDPVKYPVDFPVFYEELGLADVRFRVMAWDESLRKAYAWHRFDDRWDLLGPGREPAETFLQSLDLFVYPLGHRVRESWGRSTVEAMLTGAIPLVPTGHQFHRLIESGETGYLCTTFAEYRDAVHELHAHHEFRRRLSRQCADHARSALCDASRHRETWIAAVSSPGSN